MEIKKFIITDIIILLIKILSGLLCKSLTIIASAYYDLALIIISLIVLLSKENKRYKGVLSSLLSFILIIGSILLIFISFIIPIWYPSLFTILFIIICLLANYLVKCYYINKNYQRKKGLLSFNNINSTIDFIITGIIIITPILSKLSHFLPILKYADRLGVICISSLTIIRCLKIILRSINFLEDQELNKISKEEISSREEVNKIENISINSFGGLNHLTISLRLNESISMLDINTFIINLEDYILKYVDIISIKMTNGLQKKKIKRPVRSLKQDARNSRSRNSKTNPKKKNTRKKNKKH